MTNYELLLTHTAAILFGGLIWHLILVGCVKSINGVTIYKDNK